MWVYLRVNEPLPYLCFTAEQANSTLTLNKVWSPTAVSLETSTDWQTWSDYTIGSLITLVNIGDKVYWRNKSSTQDFNGYWDQYRFSITWSIVWSWDITSLLNKDFTDTIPAFWFAYLFYGCTQLTTPPKLPATILSSYWYYYMFSGCLWLTEAPSLPATTINANCYRYMFYWCSNMVTLPKLPATTLANNCYREMFNWCSKIKLSTTQTWEYQTPYTIPSEWTWTVWSYSLQDMFTSTWWTFTWTPTINTTYYTSNTVV